MNTNLPCDGEFLDDLDLPSCIKKRRSWTDLSDHVNGYDHKQRLIRNGVVMRSCLCTSPDIGPRGLRVLQSNLIERLQLVEKLTLESSQWKGSTLSRHLSITFSLRSNCPFSLLFLSTGVLGVHSTHHIAIMSPIGSAKTAQKESTMARVLGAGMYNHINAIISIAQILTTSQALPVSLSSPSSTPSTPSPSV